MKNLKKIFCLVCCMMLCCTSLSAKASTEVDITQQSYCQDVLLQISQYPSLRMMAEEDMIDTSQSFLLYNFAEEPIAIFYKLAPIGYAIYDYQNGIVLEYTTECDNPFYTEKGKRYYYEGILEYYIRTEEGFLNLTTNTVREIDMSNYSFTVNDFYSKDIHRKENDLNAYSASEGPVYLLKTTRLYNCNVRDNFATFYPDKTQQELDKCPGVCGSVATAIMLECYDDYYSLPSGYSFVDSSVKNSNPYYENIYGIELVKQLIPYIEPNANGSFFLNPGVSTYLRERNIIGRVSLGVLSVYQQTKNAIGADGYGWPVIVGTSSHYCVAIGYQNNTEKQIYVNTGYGYKAWYNASTIVSTWTMNIDGTQ